MSELDDLRRIAYGRTLGPGEEAAAADARARLAEHETRQRQTRAESEAAQFAHSRSAEREPEGDSETDDRITLTIVDPHDEPGYLHRLVTTWRVWVVPAFAAFVIGIVLTVASGVLVLRNFALDGSATSTTIVTEPGSPVLESGDLQEASAVLARPQEPDDTVAGLDGSIDATTTHLLRRSASDSTYGAISTQGEICLIAVPPTDVIVTCAPPSAFPRNGLAIGWIDGDVAVRLHWDGKAVTETRTTQ